MIHRVHIHTQIFIHTVHSSTFLRTWILKQTSHLLFFPAAWQSFHLYVCHYFRGGCFPLTLTHSRSYFGDTSYWGYFTSCMLNVTYFYLSLYSLPSVFLFMSLFLAAFLHSVKPWPTVRESPYGPTAGPFSLSLSISACVRVLRVRTCVFCPLSVFPRCQQPSVWLCLPLSIALLWEQLPVFEWAWTKFSTHPHLVHPASI